MRLAVYLAVAAFAYAQTILPPQQAKPDEKCTLEGSVVNAATGDPVKKARVMLIKMEASGALPVTSGTDASGRFKLENIDPGRYRLTASRSGFAREAPTGRKSDAPPLLTLTAGQSVTGLVFRLWPAAVIAGRVTDQDGDPLENVQVQALRYRYFQGNRQLAPWGGTMSDDRGLYRIHGLPAGRYYLRATYSDMFAMGAGQAAGSTREQEGYAPVYYPGVVDPAQAPPLRLRSGEEREGTDFRLTPVRTATVRGRVLNASRRAMVTIVPRRQSMMDGFGLSFAATQPNGGFELRSVTPGSYFVIARSGTEERLTARRQIEVGTTNIEGVELTLMPGVEVKGHVEIEGAGEQKVALQDMRISLNPQLPGAAGYGGEVRADGSFELRNIEPGDYRLYQYPLKEDYYLKSARLGDSDALNGVHIGEAAGGTLEVVLSPSGARVDGSVAGDQNKPAPGATVVLAPESDKTRTDLYKTAETDQYGRFSLRGIAPGSYKLYAWDNVEPGAWQDPAFLESYKDQGKKVTLEEKSRESAELSVLHSADSN